MLRVWILNDLFVLPEHRNQGVAKALMSKAKENAISALHSAYDSRYRSY